MKSVSALRLSLIGLLLLCVPRALAAAELVTLSPANFADYAPGGKEADAVFGDYVLRNDLIAAAIADPALITGRSAQRWAIPNVAGCLIDLTRRDKPNDQLVAWYPTHLRYKPDAPQAQADFVDEAVAHTLPGREPRSGRRVTLALPAYTLDNGRSVEELAALPPARRPPPAPTLQVQYTLEDGWDYVLIESIYRNPTSVPCPLDCRWRIRTDPTLPRGASDGVFHVFDPYRDQAYALIAEGVALVRDPGDPSACRPAPPLPVVPPDGELRIVMRLAAGRSLFDVLGRADALRGQEPSGVRLRAVNTWGAIAGAEIAWQDGTGAARSGRTDAQGMLDLLLPAGRHTLRASTIAGSRRFEIDTAGKDVRTIELPAGGRLRAEVVDGQGRPLPAKCAVYGEDGTPDPVFCDVSGATRARNLIYAPDGRADQELAPGRYRIVVSRGAEYAPVERSVEIEAGQTVDLPVRLTRTIDTAGWIAADLHNHSTLSGESEIFYMSTLPGYTWDASVDGNSFADPAGAVLAAACAGIEFAPAAEHNVTFDYSALVAQLGLNNWLATCPGVGMTAGRRHAHYHINAFPVPYTPGAQDGGTLQRAQHTPMQPWMAHKWPGGDKLMVIHKPRQETLTVKPGMDALDLYDLRPLIRGAPLPDTDNVALEWLALLRDGYRLPGVAGDDSFDNYHGPGRQFIYVQCGAADNPSAVDPLDVVRAVREGRALMTTGPFMTVRLATRYRRAEVIAGPGAEAPTDTGRGTLTVTLACLPHVQLDCLQVLRNGRHDGVNHLPSPLPAGPGGNPAQPLSVAIPLELDADCFLVAVASGSGRNYGHPALGETRTHVAVSNPIWVDADGDGYTPHSPLDDKVSTRIVWRRQPLALEGAEPGLFSVRLRNHGNVAARDVVAPEFAPPGRFELTGAERRAYALAPGEERDLDFRVRFTDAWLARGLPADTVSYVETGPQAVVPRSARFPGRAACSSRVFVHHPIAQLDRVEGPEQAAAAVADAPVYTVERGSATLGRLQWALLGDCVGLYARVSDARVERVEPIWQGSCVELFAANAFKDERKRIEQVYLLPATKNAPAEAYRELDGRIVPAPEVAIASSDARDGYELSALVPLSLLPVEIESGLVRIDARVNAAPGAAATRLRATVFKSGAPHVDHLQYGRMRIRGRVLPAIEPLREIGSDPDAAPGQVRLTLVNDSDSPAADVVALRAEPADAVRVLESGSFAFELAPGASASRVFELALRKGAGAGVAEISTTLSADRLVYPASPVQLPVAPRSLERLALFPGAAQEAFEALPAYTLQDDAGALGTVRFGVKGDALAIGAEIVDLHPMQHDDPWRASCLELFGALPRSGARIGQVFLVPAVGEQPARALVKQEHGYAGAVGAAVSAEATENGYRLFALVPFELLALDPLAPVISLEAQVTSVLEPAAKPKVRRAVLFGSKLAYMDASRYGRFRIREP